MNKIPKNFFAAFLMLVLRYIRFRKKSNDSWAILLIKKADRKISAGFLATELTIYSESYLTSIIF
jgi:hypothetical protein